MGNHAKIALMCECNHSCTPANAHETLKSSDAKLFWPRIVPWRSQMLKVTLPPGWWSVTPHRPRKTQFGSTGCVNCFALLPPFCLFCNRWNPTILHSIGHAESADIASGLNLASKARLKKMLGIFPWNSAAGNQHSNAQSSCGCMPSLDLKPS